MAKTVSNVLEEESAIKEVTPPANMAIRPEKATVFSEETAAINMHNIPNSIPISLKGISGFKI